MKAPRRLNCKHMSHCRDQLTNRKAIKNCNRLLVEGRHNDRCRPDSMDDLHSFMRFYTYRYWFGLSYNVRKDTIVISTSYIKTLLISMGIIILFLKILEMKFKNQNLNSMLRYFTYTLSTWECLKKVKFL